MNVERILVNALEASIGLQAVVFALAAIGLNVHFGYTGLLNFGQSAFLAVAGYGLAVMVATFGLPFWVGILVGLVGAVVLALLLGVPTLRLRADYLAMATIAAAEIVRLIARSVTFADTLGGSDGRQNFAGGFYSLNPYSEGSYNIGSFGFNERQMWILTVGWTLVGLCCLVVFLLMRSPWGRVLKAIREDEDAVRSLGKNVYSYKMQSLILGGVYGTLAGMIFILPRAVVPANYQTSLTFFIYAILLLGGAATILGPVIGSMIFWVLLSFFSGFVARAVEAGWLPFMSQVQAGQLRFILVGVAIMLIVIFRPQGIFGNKKELAFVK